jgi:prepilin-type N-terminal cleavage/methylation domain-containing protein
MQNQPKESDIMSSIMQRYAARNQGDGTEVGFTLIELLIVIVVLGVLAGVTVFALGGVTKQSAAAACNSDASAVNVAVQAWNAQNSNVTAPATPAAWVTALSPTYLQTFPVSTHYTITVTATTGVVMVAAPSSATAAAYVVGATPNSCANAA